MIYPKTTGKPTETLRLNTLESIWIQGKLRMWGRWSYIGDGGVGGSFNQLLATKKITKTAIMEIRRRMKKAGITEGELVKFFEEMMAGKQKSHLAFCTDGEALKIDGVITRTLSDNPRLISMLRQRYMGAGTSKLKMAQRLHERHPEWSLATCRNRIDAWLSVAESMIYLPMQEAFILVD
ncbi:DUF1133 family protein [Lelliottia amnigena]|uniref:DUF1133 family protein n=1 Tax=Lelliottia amnigena TaxID=61646 RepID=UPI00192AADD7|nr:DUF1133 family protein [Lelliottia amnigena]MBL5920629.1 DUF1133 family protein [Lelliottia amnigena]